MTILKNLNPEQKAAVEHMEGPSMIVAGAGSGKTRVLTFKIAYLIENGYDPSSILALTFTNKAANEMKQRIKELIGARAEQLWMGTFHSVFARILRMEADKIDYKSNFSIYDAEDSASLVSSILSEQNVTIEGITSSGIHHKISYLKNNMIYPKEYSEQIASSFLEKKIAEVYSEYNKRLRENNAMDFDDLLLKPIELFNKNEKVVQKYRKRFSYLLVDEYQDTNRAQYEILKLLVSGKKNICVVGDDAQSIYGWRGADIRNMLDFERDFPKTKVYRLEQNYRSTKKILLAADSVIKKNQDQIAKTLWTNNNDGEELTIAKCSDEKDEALQVTKFIKDEISKKKLSYKHFAVFYRINAQSRAMEDAFRRERIPYKIIGGVEFYRRKEIKDILAYLRVLTNQNDEESLLRIMNFPQRGIGNTSISRMIAFARKLNLTLFDTMARVFEVIEVKERIQKNVKAFKLLLDKYIDLKDQLSLPELTSALIDELGILRVYKEENTMESMQRYENVQELINAVNDYYHTAPEASIDNFLAEVSLITSVDQMENEQNSVTLMTIHSAKGLEFPVVFVTGCEEDIFPLAPKFNSDSRIEEERRLFYVAITRARQKVFITYARSRYRFGEVAYQSKSRFIEDLDPSTYFEVNGTAGRKSGRRSKKSLYDKMYQEDYEDFNQEHKSLRIGSKVSHEKFGQGKVVAVSGVGDMQKVTVAFEETGLKNLLVKFANLRII